MALPENESNRLVSVPEAYQETCRLDVAFLSPCSFEGEEEKKSETKHKKDRDRRMSEINARRTKDSGSNRKLRSQFQI